MITPRNRIMAKARPMRMERSGFVKSRTSNNRILKLRDGGFLLKCGNSVKKYADYYTVYMGEEVGDVELVYGKVSPYQDFTPTGENWEQFYGSKSIPTPYDGVDIVAEAYMFIKPYSVDNDNRKRKIPESSTIEVGDFYFEGTNDRMDRFREWHPELNGVSDDHVVDMPEWAEWNAMVDENNRAIQMVKVSGKAKFWAYQYGSDTLELLAEHKLSSSSDFFNSVEEYITWMESNANGIWNDVRNKFYEYVISHGLAEDGDVRYLSSARKARHIRRSAPMGRPVAKARPIARPVRKSVGPTVVKKRQQPKSAW